MSAADCRSGRCGCAAASVIERLLVQTVEFGRRVGDGFVFDGDLFAAQVSERWAKHIEARRTDPSVFVAWIDGWLVYRTHPGTGGLEDLVTRIRWEPAA